MPETLVFVISQNADGFRWRLCGEDMRVIAIGAEACASLMRCREEVELVKGSWVAGVELGAAGSGGDASR